MVVIHYFCIWLVAMVITLAFCLSVEQNDHLGIAKSPWALRRQLGAQEIDHTIGFLVVVIDHALHSRAQLTTARLTLVLIKLFIPSPVTVDAIIVVEINRDFSDVLNGC